MISILEVLDIISFFVWDIAKKIVKDSLLAIVGTVHVPLGNLTLKLEPEMIHDIVGSVAACAVVCLIWYMEYCLLYYLARFISQVFDGNDKQKNSGQRTLRDDHDWSYWDGPLPVTTYEYLRQQKKLLKNIQNDPSNRRYYESRLARLGAWRSLYGDNDLDDHRDEPPLLTDEEFARRKEELLMLKKKNPSFRLLYQRKLNRLSLRQNMR